MRSKQLDVSNQTASLKLIAGLITRGASDQLVRETALVLTNDCKGRDEDCELRAIFNAVKSGDPRVPGLSRGLRYVADPRDGDYFSGPRALLEMCRKGACGEDCDGHTALVASLCAAIGYRVGARAWRPAKTKDFVHVYAVVALPKRGPFTRAAGLDTTVPDSDIGWEPPISDPKQILTAWIE